MTHHPEHLDIAVPHLDALYIGGRWQRSAQPQMVDVISPTTEKSIARVALPTG